MKDFKGEISFRISNSDYLSFKDIEERLNLRPTKTVEKGRLVTAKIKAPTNIWSYKVKFTDHDSFGYQLSGLVAKLWTRRETINQLIGKYDSVEVHFYIRSLEGQLGWTIAGKEIKLLSELKVDIDFHILSYGYVLE